MAIFQIHYHISRSGVKIELASCLSNKDSLTPSEKLPNKILCSFFRKQKKKEYSGISWPLKSDFQKNVWLSGFLSSSVIYLSIDEDALFSYSMKACIKRLVSSTVNMEVFLPQLPLDSKKKKNRNLQFSQLYFQQLFSADAYSDNFIKSTILMPIRKC